MGYRHRVARVNNSRQRKQRPGVGVLICTEEEEYYRTDYESPGRLLLRGFPNAVKWKGWI